MAPWPESDTLVGWYFLTADENGEILNQGAIKERISDTGHYLVVLFSWLTGGENGHFIVHFDDIAEYFLLTGKNQEEHDFYAQKKKITRPAYHVGWGRKGKPAKENNDAP